MSHDQPDEWGILQSRLQNLRNKISSLRVVRINSAPIRNEVKQVVQLYFRDVRPELVGLGLDLAGFDEAMQGLLRLTNSRARKRSYMSSLATLSSLGTAVEPLRELRLGQLNAEKRKHASVQSAAETKIIGTLEKLVPSAALSYQQSIKDLEVDRLSYRGVAAELREVLREVIDHLAPDNAVMQSAGFQLESGHNRPTMKQKVRFILRSRGLPGSARKVPEDALSRVDEGTASLARSVYDRGSLSTHIAASKKEVKHLKMYVDTLLAELLEVHE